MTRLDARPKPLDRRIARTRKALYDALLQLITRCGYENITIRALTQAAQVGAATFHRHYKNLDDLLVSLLRETDDELTRRIHRQETLFDEALTMFRFIKANQDLYRFRLSLPESHPVRQLTDETAMEAHRARWKRHNNTITPFDLSLEAIVIKTDTLVQYYLNHIDLYSPEEIADMHFQIILLPALNTLQLRPGWALAPNY